MNHLRRTLNSITDFRDRVAAVLGTAMVPFLLPFSLNGFMQGRLVTGVLILVLVVLAVVNVISIVRNDRQNIPYGVFYVFILLPILLGIIEIGAVVAFWCYPAALSILFVARLREARVLTGIGVVLLVPFSFLYMSPDYAARFSATYILTCIFGYLIVKLLDEQQEKLTELATTDPLTGAFNRRHMQECLLDAIEQQRRGLNAVSLIALDADHFKKINDLLGHEAGDNVLKNLVDVLHRRTRKIDLVFRTGGEEFIILVQNTASEQAGVFAESLREFIEQTQLLEGVPLTVSLGVAHYEDGEDIDTWLRRADHNLLEAKRRGRNRVWPMPPTTLGAATPPSRKSGRPDL